MDLFFLLQPTFFFPELSASFASVTFLMSGETLAQTDKVTEIFTDRWLCVEGR